MGAKLGLIFREDRRMVFENRVLRIFDLKQNEVIRGWIGYVLLGKPVAKKLLGRSRCMWVDNIKMDLGEIGCGGMDWIGLVQDRHKWRALVNVVMKLLIS
jgi:hypothetical protein